mgnify:CR=1 FL=1
MRYHYEQPDIYFVQYGKTYKCDHPVYDECTLYKIGELGLAIIQQRRAKDSKLTYWSSIDPWLIDELYLHEHFIDLFKKFAKEESKGLYPTLTIRQAMWRLKMKPMQREPWETVFDKSPI